MDINISELAESIKNGDRRSLAKSITLVESTKEEHRKQAKELIDSVLDTNKKTFRMEPIMAEV